MANTPKPASLITVSDDEWDAIKLSGGPGRTAKPSTQLDTLRAAIKEMPTNGKYPTERDGWYRIPASPPNTVEVIARELRKGVKQLNSDRKPNEQLKVETRPRKDHPKLSDFVAFRVTIVLVEETPTENKAS